MWLSTGALVQPLPAGLAVRDETGFDTRVIDKDVKKRGRRLSSETVVPQEAKQLRKTATGSKGEAARPGRPKRKQQKKPAAGTAINAWEAPNLYSRAAFVTHGDGSLGLLARRRARGARPPRSGAGDLPAGWRMVVKTVHRGPQAGSKYKVYLHEASGRSFPTLAQAKAHWEGHGPPAAEAVGAFTASTPGDQQGLQEGLPPGWHLVWAALEEGLQAGQQGQQRQAFYVSPEGLVFEEWDEVEQWLEVDASSGCPPPSELLSTLHGAAVAQQDALPAGPAVLLTLLGLQRARVALFKEERQHLERATAAAAAAGEGAPARPSRQPSAGSKRRGSTGTGSQGRAAAAAAASSQEAKRGRQQQKPTAVDVADEIDFKLAGAPLVGGLAAGSGPAADSTGAGGLPTGGQQSLPAGAIDAAVPQVTEGTRPVEQQQLAMVAEKHGRAGQDRPAAATLESVAQLRTLAAEPEVIDLT